MGTTIHVTQSFAAPALAVRAMMTDPDYIRVRAEQTGATDVSVAVSSRTDGCIVVSVDRTLPAQVPSFAAALVGDSLTVSEEQTWQPLSADRCTADLKARFSGPLSFTGSMQVIGAGDRTTVTTVGELKASVPFIGGRIEGLAKEQIERYLAAEEQVAADWLAD
jgi:hypothetical protein